MVFIETELTEHQTDTLPSPVELFRGAVAIKPYSVSFSLNHLFQMKIHARDGISQAFLENLFFIDDCHLQLFLLRKNF